MRAHPNIGFTGPYIKFLKIVNMLMITPELQEPNLKYFHVPNAKFFSQNMDVYGDVDDKDWNEGVIMGFVNTMDPVNTH